MADPLVAAATEALWRLLPSEVQDGYDLSDVGQWMADVVAAALRGIADEIDRGPTFPMPPTVISALIRERADTLEASRG